MIAKNLRGQRRSLSQETLEGFLFFGDRFYRSFA